MMCLCLPNPSNLDALPSSIKNKWSTTTHPLNGEIFELHHFHHLIPTFLPSPWTCPSHQGIPTSTSTTSTNLNDITRHYVTTLVTLVLRLCPGLKHGTRRSKCSFLNMLLSNLVTLTNLAPSPILMLPSSLTSP
jgi:hypothetical protein